jgi:hypothetical protein
MLRTLGFLIAVVAVPLLAVNARAADTKPIKSDVTVKQDAKMANAKVGDVVEIQLDSLPAGSSDATTGLSVSIEKSKVLKDKHDERDIAQTAAGKGGFKSIYVYPAAEGKATVTVEFKKGGKAQKHQYEIQVKGKK